jgi:gamma-glutamyltranspeptidase / glutathione hydrolase
VAGGKRPLHTIIPAFLTRGGQPAMAFGVMGGNMQAQGHTQMVLRHVAEGHNPQACATRRAGASTMPSALTLECTVPAAVVEGLRERGHQPQVAPADSLAFGSAQRYAGGSDPRRDGQVVGC